MIGAVYPRACGGTPFLFQVPQPRQRLSPRVRGNPGGGLHLAAERSSIPARAGEPPLSLTAPGMRPVYPRACGLKRVEG